ncbi:MAG: efflux RND transporter periplasmic adaptor subunit [Deltaproteobacteria bacterium]|nr:efflux RND transporter periplasmic adaptor subunit [Deltaproteobacteria bacterium]
MPKISSYARLLSVLAAAVTVCFSMADRTSAQPGPPGAAPPVVTVLKVPEKDVNPAAEYVGRIEAIQSVDLKARVDGYIRKMAFEEGGEVAAGRLLFQLERAPYEAELNEALAKVALAGATLDKALRYIERLKSVRAGGVAATDMDSALAAKQTARALMQQAEAVLQKAKLNLGYTTIKAPIGGRIGRAAYTLGNLVGPDSGALARIVQLDPIRVVYSVSENEYVTDRMKAADNPDHLPAELVPNLKLPNGLMYPTAGRMDFSDPQVDPGTGTIAVRAVFDNPVDILLPGQYVTVLVSRRRPLRLPVVPQSAVLEDKDGLYVLAVDPENRVQVRRIARGAAVGTGWAVTSGLKAGDSIVVYGLQKVRPGQTVRTVRAEEE